MMAGECFRLASIGRLAVLCVCGTAAADKFEIHLDRRMAVGQRYQITAIHEAIESDVDQTGHHTDNDDGMRIDATEDVLAVSKIGCETKAKLTVQQFFRVKDGNRTPLAKRGGGAGR